jgi:hypothetical protein
MDRRHVTLLSCLALGVLVSVARPSVPAGAGPDEQQPSATPSATGIGALPDLRINALNFAFGPTTRCEGDPIQRGVTAYVENAGDGPAGAFNIAVLSLRHRVMSLGPGEIRAVWFDDYRAEGQGETEAEVDVDHEVAERREDNNRRQEIVPLATIDVFPCTATPTPPPAGTRPPPGLPDLAPAVTYDWTCPCYPCPEHEPFGLVCIHNTGSAPAGRSWNDIIFARTSELMDLGSLAAGANACRRIPNQTVDVIADPAGRIAESDEANNRIHGWGATYTPPPPCGNATATFTPPPPPPRPDLVITRGQVSQVPVACRGQPDQFVVQSVYVKNQGAAPAGPFVVRAEPGPEPSWTVDGLAAGEGRSLDDRPGRANAIVADADGAVAEADETNNRYVIPTLLPFTPPPTCSATPTPTATAGPMHLPRVDR